MLILANAVPILGVVFLHWTVFSVILLYWTENVIIGGFNVLRMLTADPGDGVVWVGKAFLIPFFCIHFGMFTFIHGQLVLAFFGGEAFRRSSFHVAGLIQAVGQAGIGYGVLFLVLSHTFSFIHDWLVSGEYRRASIRLLMGQPYSRILVLHFTILFGGFLVQLAGAPVLAVVLLVILKTAIDLRAHQTERQKLALAPVAERSERGASSG